MTSFCQDDNRDVLRAKASCLTMEEALNVIEIYRDVPGHGRRFAAAARGHIEALNRAERKADQQTETRRYRVMLWLGVVTLVFAFLSVVVTILLAL